MATDVVGIYNLALSAAGTDASVSSPTEQSREAEVCTFWYDIARDQVLRAAHWPEAKGFKRLAVLAERDTAVDWDSNAPEPGYAFAYGLPSDLLYPRNLTTFTRFTMGLYQNITPALMTNLESAILVYTLRQEQVQNWNAQLQLAIAYALAAYVTMPLLGKLKRAELMQKTANGLIGEARATMLNSTDDEYQTMPEWITARGFSGAAPATRFIYPFGDLIQVSGGVSVS